MDRNTYVARDVAPRPAPALLLLWGLFIAYATMLPFDFSASGDRISSRVHRLWESPLRGGGGSWHDVHTNVLLFVPWGLLLAVSRAERGSSWLAILALAFTTGASLSGSVEFVQLFAPERQTSFVDLVTNTLGSVVGALIGWPRRGGSGQSLRFGYVEYFSQARWLRVHW